MTSRIIRRTKTSCLLLSLLLNNSSNAFTVPSSSLSSSSRLNTELSYSIIEASKGDNNDNNSNNNNNNNGVKPKWSPSGGGGGGGGGSGIGFGAGSIGGAAAGGTPDFTTASMSASSSPAAASGGDDYYAAEMKRREAQTKTGNVKKSSGVPSSGAAAGGTPDFTFGSTTSSTSAASAAASPAGGSPAASSSSTFPSFGGSSAGASSGPGAAGSSSFGASSSSTTPNFSSTSASASAGPAGGSPSFGSSSSTTPSFSSGTSSIPGPAGSTPSFGASSSSSPNNSFGGASAAGGGGAPSFSSASSSPSSSFGSSTVPGPSSSSSSFGSSSSTPPNNVNNNNNFQDSNNSFPPPPSNTEEEKKEEEELPQGMVKAELNGAKDVNAAFTQKFKNDVFVNGKRQETTPVENEDEYERRKMNSYAMNSNTNNNNNYRNNNDPRRGGGAESLSNIPEGRSLEEENRLLRELAMRLEREQAELTGRRTESRIPNMSRGGRSSQPRPQQQQIRRASAAANVASNAPPRYNERHYPRNPHHTAFANVQNKMVARTDEELRAKQMEAEMNSPAFRMEGDMDPPAFYDNMDKRRQFMDVGNRNKVRSNLALARANRKLIQGKTLLTWSFMSPSVRQVQVKLTTDGRPIDAEVELWDGPDNIPHKMKIYSESGYEHPFHAILATPGGFDTVAVRNVGDMEFPVKGQVLPVSDERNGPMGVMIDTANAAAEYYMDDDQPLGPETERPQTIQGGALRSFTYGPEVESIQVLLKTQGRPIQAKIELIQGPNNNKEVIEIYTQNGEQYPFYGVFESMGRGSVIRIINTAPLEFPITVLTSPYKINYQNSHRQMAPIIR